MADNLFDTPYAATGAYPHFLERVDLLRLDAAQMLDESRKAEMGQFLTPMPVARLMASLFECQDPYIRVLDAGAGVGSLFAAYVYALCQRHNKPQEISVTAYEIDELLGAYLRETLTLCQIECERVGIQFRGEVQPMDFIESAVDCLNGGLFTSSTLADRFNCAILNPPYRKIRAESDTRKRLRQIGIETTNLYTGFLAAAIQLLEPGGELVAITPRSFCNGPYFTSFRKWFLHTTTLQRLHLFESRQHAFQDDNVLQENVILHTIKGRGTPERVLITSSEGSEDELFSSRVVKYSQVVYPKDPHAFIHIVPDDLGQRIAERMGQLTHTLDELGLSISTGRVVDFRALDFLRPSPEEGTAPLIYPTHFNQEGYISWPKAETKKPNALVDVAETQDLLIPNEHYVLVKRFSAKEERKRIVAAVYDAQRITAQRVGFENHLNYFHYKGKGLSLILAKGLAAFLNSRVVDSYFRQFNGHTQVNATDLRNMRYPSLSQLEALGARIHSTFPNQNELDRLVEEECLGMADQQGVNPLQAKRRIEEALHILSMLGLPRQQQNERSALTLLALLDLQPSTPWEEATNPLRGITPMMDYFAEHYGKTYAPNTRETVRRQTVHQFLDAGLIVANPDNPERPVNSPKAVYQIERSTLELLKTFGTPEWEHNLRAYLASIKTLKERYAQEREMARIPVVVAPGKTITLSPGGQNILVEQIINEFAPRYIPGGSILYVGDTDDKFAYFDREALEALGVKIEAHGKMPDVIIHHTSQDWLILIEAVTSHGPIDPKRKEELRHLFSGCAIGIVYVTTFLTRKAMVEYLDDISWETEVWVAESPSHLIHFNGERFLGPY